MTPSSHRLRKFILSFGLVCASIAYAVSQDTDQTVTPAGGGRTASRETPGAALQSANQQLQETLSEIFAEDEETVTPPASSVPPSPTTPTPTPAPTQTPASTGAYRDGSYTGTAADAYYGTIQVKAVIAGGKLSDVIFLQYPNDRGNSIRINGMAMPLLKQEAIQAQSATVDGVSGATFTSEAFRKSLGSALAQATA